MPPVFTVIVVPRAFKDLDGILDYIARDSPQNAATTIDGLWRAMQSLVQLPHRYKVHESRKDASMTVRSMPVAPFIIYYRVDDVRRVVRVLTVRHGHQRQPKRFK
jgi:plasmid stabilization system protein ParE